MDFVYHVEIIDPDHPVDDHHAPKSLHKFLKAGAGDCTEGEETPLADAESGMECIIQAA